MRLDNTFAKRILQYFLPFITKKFISDAAPEHVAAPDARDIDAATIVHASPGPIRGAQLNDKIEQGVQGVLALGGVVEKVSYTCAPQSPQRRGIILVLRLGECQVEDKPYDLVPA